MLDVKNLSVALRILQSRSEIEEVGAGLVAAIAIQRHRQPQPRLHHIVQPQRYDPEPKSANPLPPLLLPCSFGLTRTLGAGTLGKGSLVRLGCLAGDLLFAWMVDPLPFLFLLSLPQQIGNVQDLGIIVTVLRGQPLLQAGGRS
jgi:hypothetical protein